LVFNPARQWKGGVTGIQKAEVNGSLVRVTVSTATGTQVWSYQPALVGPWQRVN
jgi:hypothetical protein